MSANGDARRSAGTSPLRTGRNQQIIEFGGTLMLNKALSFIAAALLTAAPLALAQEREEARIIVATEVLEEIKDMRDQNVPDWLLERAHGIAVIPDVVKVGLIFGGRRGKGVMVVRDAQGRWSNPVFVTLTGGSIGWQVGVQSTDVVLVFTTRRGVEGISDGKLTLGADASVAAGPVGRQTSAATDANLSAEVYSYSRAKGLFAGIALDGSALTIDGKANAAYYRKPAVSAGDIMSASAPPPPPSGLRFMSAISGGADTTAMQPAPAAGNKDDKPEAAPLKTFPMEDPEPGKRPPPQ
jgi:lipid-binding SYLF domain-containing protein